MHAVTSYKGTGSAEERFTETGLRFSQHIADLRQVLTLLQNDIAAFVAYVHAFVDW